jgi:DNA-binding ferritin-like protein
MMDNEDISPEAAKKVLGMSDRVDGMLEKILEDDQFKKLAKEYKQVLEDAEENGEEPDQDRLKEIGEKMDKRMKELD